MPYTTFKYVYPSLLDKQKEYAEADLMNKEPLSYSIYERALVLPAVFNLKRGNGLGGGV